MCSLPTLRFSEIHWTCMMKTTICGRILSSSAWAPTRMCPTLQALKTTILLVDGGSFLSQALGAIPPLKLFLDVASSPIPPLRMTATTAPQLRPVSLFHRNLSTLLFVPCICCCCFWIERRNKLLDNIYIYPSFERTMEQNMFSPYAFLLLTI